MEKQQRQQVEKNMQEAREKLEAEMEDAYHEHQANLLRQGGILWYLSICGVGGLTMPSGFENLNR